MRRTLGALFTVLGLANFGAAQVVRVADTVPLADADFYGDAARSAAAIVVAVTTPTEAQIAVSTDGGRSWVRRPATGAVGSSQGIAVQDPGIVDIISPGFSHVRSTDLGFTWSGPHPLPADIGESRTYSDVATSTGGIVAIIGIGASSSQLRVATSSDGGITWSTTTFASGLDGVAGSSSLTWLSTSELLACWMPDRASLHCARLTDSGTTFGLPVEAARVPPLPDGFYSLSYGAVARSSTEVIIGLSVSASIDSCPPPVTPGPPTTLDFIRSTDGGDSWSTPQTLATAANPEWQFTSPSLSVSSTGEVWLAASTTIGVAGSRPPDQTELWRSPNGVVWTRAPRVPNCAHAAAAPQVLAGGDLEAWYRSASTMWGISAGLGWRTLDGAVSWEAPVDIGLTLPPTQGVRLTRLAGGRLVAMWIEGTTPPAGLRASYSDDDGVTWSSPPVDVSDVVISERDDYPTPVYEFDYSHLSISFRYPRFDVVALRGGGMSVLWLARGASASCGELRVSRSSDGSSFQPSIAIDDFDGFPLSIAEDGGEVLVSTWFLGGDLVAARSIDGGATWSPPSAIVGQNPLDATWSATEVITTADGSLGISTIRNGLRPSPMPCCNWGDTTAEYRASSDGGLSWRLTASFTRAGVLGWQPVLVNAGPRLVLAWAELQPPPSEWVMWMNLESTDSGNSFRWLQPDGWFGGVVYNRPLVIGDDLGSIFYTWPNDAVLKHPMGANAREVAAWMPENDLISNAIEPSLLTTNGDLSVLFADWSTRTSAGVFYAAIPCSCRVTSKPPPSLTSCSGAPITLSIAADLNPSYQWYDSTGPIHGATSPDLTLTDPVDGERYRAWVYNDCSGRFASDTLVTMVDQPNVIDAPHSATVCEGAPLQLAMTASDATSYQWSKDGVAIAGATAAAYAVAAATTADAGDYTVEITGSCGVVISPPAVVTVETSLGPIASNLYLIRDGIDLRFHWNDVDVAKSYEIRDDLAPNGAFTSLTAAMLRGTPSITVPMPADDLRFYRLAGVNSCGSGAP